MVVILLVVGDPSGSQELRSLTGVEEDLLAAGELRIPGQALVRPVPGAAGQDEELHVLSSHRDVGWQEQLRGITIVADGDAETSVVRSVLRAGEHNGPADSVRRNDHHRRGRLVRQVDDPLTVGEVDLVATAVRHGALRQRGPLVEGEGREGLGEGLADVAGRQHAGENLQAHRAVEPIRAEAGTAVVFTAVVVDAAGKAKRQESEKAGLASFSSRKNESCHRHLQCVALPPPVGNGFQM